MNCSACGTAVPNDATFCHQCGAKLGGSAEPGGAEKLKERVQASRGATDPEEDIWSGGYSPKAMFGAWVGGGLVTVALVVGAVVAMATMPLVAVVLGAGVVVLWVVLLGTYFYRRLAIHYRLTSQRFFHETGVLRRSTNRIECIDMDDIAWEQGLIERMLGIGTIRIISSDASDPVLTLRGIDNVLDVAGKLDNARLMERRRRGLHIESV